jgi:hypothetical protein
MRSISRRLTTPHPRHHPRKRKKRRRRRGSKA